MGFFRSAYISAFITYLLAGLGYSGLQLARGLEPQASWLGMALAMLGPLAFFGWVFLSKPARTHRHPVGFSILSGLGLALTMAMSWRFGEAAGSIHIWAGLALVCWMVYLLWYSPFRNRNAAALVPGQALDPFELEDIDGHLLKSSQITDRPVIWLFYRGNWCPFCTAQISELARKYREIEAAGASVVLVSPQPLTKQQAIAAKFDLPLNFLRDPGNRSAKQLGIFDAWGTPLGMQVLGYDSDTVLPTVIITGTDGRIVYSHQTDNYRIRPEPGDFLNILESIKADET
jgi:peroxiredoxin/multidrug transporter EmrE-like cation transporter